MKAAVIATIWFFAVSSAFASTIHVPSEQRTIQGGINAASIGDTLIVAPGVYRENINFKGKGLVLTSSAGPDFTTITAFAPNAPTVQMINREPKGTTIQGFTITGSTVGGVTCSSSSPTIIGNRIFANGGFIHPVSSGISLNGTTGSFVCGNIVASDTSDVGAGINVSDNGAPSSNDTICYNVFHDDYAIGVIRAAGAVTGLTIYNNTITSAPYHGILLQCTGPVDIRNNVICNVPQGFAIAGGASLSSALCSYNDIFSVNGSFSGVTQGVGNISSDPLFLDSANYDYRLAFNSPCIDAGDPSPRFDDSNGTRNDMGAVPYAPPYVWKINVGKDKLSRVSNLNPTFCWSLARESAGQTAFELEVATDPAGTTGVMWQPGVINSSDTALRYAGVALSQGGTYFFRIRVYDGVNWSNWTFQSFHLDAPPAVPVLMTPTAGALVPVAAVVLKVFNSSDFEADSLKYDFEVFADPNLTFQLGSEYGVPGQQDSTASDAFLGLSASGNKWWRARAFDGTLYSPWSAPALFIARPPITINVPADFGSIQEGVEAAGEGDTVLVGPGTYPGNVLFPQRNIVLRSSAGPLRTIMVEVPGRDLIIFSGGVDSRTVVEGFSLVGGRFAVWCKNSAPTIRYNLMYNQTTPDVASIVLTSDDWGFLGNSPAKIVNNTIVGSQNGAIWSYSSPAPTIEDNIVAFNKGYGIAVVESSPANLKYNDVFGNGSNYLNVNGSGIGSINVDPKLAGDYSLTGSSPCINAGDPDAQYNDPDGTRNDLGALYFVCCTGQTRGDLDGSGKVDLADLSYLVQYLTLPGVTLPCRVSANVDMKGSINISDLSLLVAYLAGAPGSVSLPPCSTGEYLQKPSGQMSRTAH